MKTMTKADIKSLIEALAKERKLFWSEADFQFAFAWKIQQRFPNAKVRLERGFPLPESTKTAYVDIWVEIADKKFPIELKYKTRTYTAMDKTGERITLKTHSAWDVGRHSYLKDIERIEQYRSADGFERGFAIMLTNDKHYYDPKFAPSGTTDEDFVIHDGTVIHGHHEMVWHSEKKWATSLGSITIPHDYPMHWEHYSDAEDHKGDFKYVMTEITK